jgi:peptidoglycan L-alanyl-D-glutamate endopeptidase CwlK
MSLVLNRQSEARLKGVHPDLIKVIRRVQSNWKDPSLGFVITSGVRTLEEQQKLVKSGASKTLRSKHLKQKDGYGHAFDIAVTLDGKVRWDWPLYDKVSKLFLNAAKAEKVKITWGGDWPRFRDGPHYQLEP